MRFVIVGCGSMGRRRARCLRKLGFEAIAAVDPRQDRREAMAEHAQAGMYATLEDALDTGVDVALICVPPHLHVEYLWQCIDAGLPAFCESPMALTLQEADQVIHASENAGVFIAPSCTYLHNRIHRQVKTYLDEGRFGRPLAAVSHVGQHVADWHPYEDYRSFYASKRSEGGMCLDMLPHDLHLFTQYFGGVRSLTCMARRRCADIESDAAASDVYDVLLDMEAGVSLTLHQDVFQRPSGAYRKIMCERGAIEWNWHSLRASDYAGPQPQWHEVELPGYDFEAMYVAELDHALRSMKGRDEYMMPPRDERRILEYVLACEQSSRSGMQICFTA